MSPAHPNNEWYQELCALAAIGEISPAEFEELREHLARCKECSHLYADFRRISAHDLGLLAALGENDQRDKEPPSFDEVPVLSRLLDRVNCQQVLPDTDSPSQLTAYRAPRLSGRCFKVFLWFKREAATYGAVALLMCIAAVTGAYLFREMRFTPMVRGLNSEIVRWKNSAEASEEQQNSTAELLLGSKSKEESLAKEFDKTRVEYAQLEAQEKGLESNLLDIQAQSAEKDRELAAARTSEDEETKRLVELQARLEQAVARTEEERQIAIGLQAKLDEAVRIPPTPESQDFSDADARDLFGARDLHIVDVFDVDTNGRPERTYGRVYYVEKKLLIFYAFDLQDKKHNRAAAGFQVWGYREPNQSRPENLGLFRLDDSALNRWVLKVDNPRVLERIDAVYVTLEPPTGSPSPRGRKLLFADLVSPPNHP